MEIDTQTVVLILSGIMVLVGVLMLQLRRKRGLPRRTLSWADRNLIANERFNAKAHINMALMGRTPRARAVWIAYAVRSRLNVIRLVQTGEHAPHRHREVDVFVAATIGVVYARTIHRGDWIAELMHTMESLELEGNSWHYWMPTERIKCSCVSGFTFIDSPDTASSFVH